MTIIHIKHCYCDHKCEQIVEGYFGDHLSWYKIKPMFKKLVQETDQSNAYMELESNKMTNDLVIVTKKGLTAAILVTIMADRRWPLWRQAFIGQNPRSTLNERLIKAINDIVMEPTQGDGQTSRHTDGRAEIYRYPPTVFGGPENIVFVLQLY